jgi:hypothetical protein
MITRAIQIRRCPLLSHVSDGCKHTAAGENEHPKQQRLHDRKISNVRASSFFGGNWSESLESTSSAPPSAGVLGR